MKGIKGFTDPRNAAELTLAPAFPAARKLARFGSLKLDLGGTGLVPGVISKPSDITGAVRHSFGSIISAKQQTETLSSSLSSALSDFDTNAQGLTKGTLIPSAGAVANGIPDPSSFLSFSSLPAGAAIPASFASQITERKAQLSALSSRMSSVFSGSAFKGVSIQENFNRTPYPLKSELDAPSTPPLAQGGQAAQNDAILKDKRSFAVVGVEVASGKPSFWSRLVSLKNIKAIPSLNKVVNQVFKDRTNSGSWSEPVSPFAAQFPYNRATQTESGHLMEFDDTPGAERIHFFHRSGSFIEFHPDGTVVYKQLKDGYCLTIGDQMVKVGGNCHISVDGNATIYAKKGLDVQSDGEINLHAKKDFNVYASNINLRAQKTFKGDGTKIDLRYITLPTSIMLVPMGGGFAPRVNLAAIIADFPKSNIRQVLSTAAHNPLDPKNANLAIKFNSTAIAVPPDNPLSNPGIYLKTAAAAVNYRARMFDAPEETDNFELYTAHISLQQSLKDIPTSRDPRQLGGTLSTPATPTLVKNIPAPNYLNFDDYKGTFAYANDFSLGGTTFRLQDVVDIAIHSDFITPLKHANSVTSSASSGTGGGSSSGGDTRPNGNSNGTPGGRSAPAI